MKISLNWINDYVDIQDIDTDWLINKLTITTAEVEEVYHTEDDVIIEIDNKSLTNRPDLWCHYGMAREISAITGKKLKDIDYIKEEELKNIKGSCKLNIDIEDKIKCLRYSAMKISNVKISNSPEFITERLVKCGLKPINIVVDLANYVMLDIGQPLHTFDSKDIDNIRVGSLEEPIKFRSLDNTERVLPQGTLMICSKDKPLAIAGIIGGEESAISGNTEGIILESATYDGAAVRKTASSLGLRTDASARYEKFLDSSLVTMAAGRFLKLLKEYEPEIVLETPLYDNIISTAKPINIDIEHRYIETYLGNSIGSDIVCDILRSLQFEVEEKNGLYSVKVPSFRATKDVTCKADIIEEILRMYGYDNIKGRPYKAETICTAKNTLKDMEYSIKDILAKKFNFNEVHSYSWYDNNWLRKLGYKYDNTIKIVNSSVKQFESLRSDMCPNILKIIYDNRKNYDEISIFEIGRAFVMKNGELTQPKHLIAAVCSSKDEETSYRYIKGICSYILKSVKNIEAQYTKVKDNYKENCLGLNYNGIQIGCLYSVPQSQLKIFGTKHVINILDINLEFLNNIPKEEIIYKLISKYPETYLDFSIITPESMQYCDIESLICKFRHQLITQIIYIDTYTGKNIPEGSKSTTIRIIIGDSSRTLRDEEINEVKGRFIDYLKQNDLSLRE